MSNSPHRGRSDHWDFIRGLSMAIMVIMHTSDIAGWKPFGIQLMHFYYPVIEPIIFLSGFLICLRALEQTAQFPGDTGGIMRLYALRRILRTWPLYFLFVIACFTFPSLPEFPVTKPLSAFLTFTMNWNLPPGGLAHLWTLCIEEWCYFIFLFCIPFLARPGINYFFLALALFPLIFRAYLVAGDGPFGYFEYFTRIHYGTLTHMDSFWWGCLLAPVYRASAAATRTRQGALLGGAVAMMAVYLAISFTFEQTALLQVTNPLWGAAVSALAVFGIHSVPAKYLRRSGLVHLGWMSYTFYLVHRVLMAAGFRLNRAFEWLEPKSYEEILGAYVFMALVGTMIFFALEYPLLELLRKKFSSSRLKTL